MVENATLSWTKPGCPPPGSHPAYGSTDAPPTLRNVSFKLHKVRRPAVARKRGSDEVRLQSLRCFLQGSLLGICGNVGSGKTSLISSILEQVRS